MEQVQEDLAVVKEVSGDIVTIEMQKDGSCDSCAMHGVCAGHDKTFIHKVKTDLDLSINDVVKVNIAPKIRIASSFLIFVFPIIMMIVFYFISHSLFKTVETTSIIVSFSGLILSGGIIYLADKKYGKNIKFDIIRKVKNEN